MTRAVVILGLLLCGTPAWAGRVSTLPGRLAACAAVRDDLRRLTCFDVLAARAPNLRYGAARPRHRRAVTAPDSCFEFNGERVCE